MNLTQITAFRAVMNSGSISEAARKIGRTQPAVSLAIRALEESLGLRLFRREGRRLVPVPEARYLLAEAEGILDRMATVSRTMHSLASARAGTLNLAAMPGPAAYLFPRFISQTVGDNDQITLSISSRSSQQIQELAGTQSIDFGFADAPIELRKNAQYIAEFISADCFCALPRDHPLAGADRIGIRDLEGMPMGTLQSDHTHQRRLLDRFREAGVGFRKKVDSQTFLPLLQFVGEGRCATIVDPLTVVSERVIDSAKGRVVFLPLEQALRYEYAILSPRYRPLSQLALVTRAAWRDELMRLLNGVGARPRVTGTADHGVSQAP